MLVPTIRVHPRVVLPSFSRGKVTYNLTPGSHKKFQTLRHPLLKNKVMTYDFHPKTGRREIRRCAECGHDYTSLSHTKRRTMWAEWYSNDLPEGLFRCNNCYRRKYKQMKKLDKKATTNKKITTATVTPNSSSKKITKTVKKTKK